jgi:hypothetical protein
MSRLRIAGLLLAFGVLSAGGTARGAEAAAENPFREQSIYVPYDKLWKDFEKTGRGVFVPYEEFERLWTAAREAGRTQPVARPPRDYLISEVSGTATVTGDVVRATAQLKIEALGKGWLKIPLRLGDVAITRATTNGSSARLVFEDGGHVLLIDNAAGAARALTLDLEFARSYTKDPGLNRVSFQAPLCPVSRWDVRVPEADAKVQVHPMLAATDAPAAAAGGGTRVVAFVGAAPEVRIEWTPKAEGARGLRALMNARAEQSVTIEEGVLRSRVRVEFEISRTEVSELAVELPADQKVTAVFDENVREWSVKASNEVQVVTVQLFQPTKGLQSLLIEMERFGETSEAVAPLVRARDVARQQGFVAVRVGAGLRGDVAKHDGLVRVDGAELPAFLSRDAGDFAYRYASVPYALVVRSEMIQPFIVSTSRVDVAVSPQSIGVTVLAVQDVQRSGVFRFPFLVPEGFEVREVRGAVEGDVPAASVEGHTLDAAADGFRLLTVNLNRKALGRSAVAIGLQRPIDDARLLSPEGGEVELPIPLVHAQPGSVARQQGRLTVYSPESLRINPRKAQGLRGVPFRSGGENGAQGDRAVLSYEFGDDPVSLSLSVERRAPHITLAQGMVITIDSGVARFDVLLSADVRYSGVRTLRVDLPASVAQNARVTTGGIRQARAEGAAAQGVASNDVAWLLSGESEFLGRTEIRLAWEEKIEKLDVGKTVELAVPRLRPRGVDRAWGQIVLAKAETLDVSAAPGLSGLIPIDPRRDLMPGLKADNAARAFEFHDEWSLAVRATRYELREVKATSIERGVVRMVLTRSGQTSVQALYRMRSARQRLQVRLPGDVAFDTQPVRVNGRPVPLEQGDKGEFFIPLLSENADSLFVLEMRYTVQGGGLTLRPPEFPMEPAVQKVYLSAYLPREQTYLGYRGPWTDEIVWVLRGFTSWPRAAKDPNWLLNWVSEDVPGDHSAMSGFATDGRHVLYSTLRPEEGVAGALRLSALHQGWIQGLLLSGIVGVGLLLLPAGAVRRLLCIGLGVVTLTAVAVFMPSLARAVVNNATAGAVFAVLVIWGMWYIAVQRPRDPEVRARREARAAARRARRSPPPMPPPAAPAAQESRP